MIPASWYSHPYIIFSSSFGYGLLPLSAAGPGDLFLRSSIWQKWWDVISEISLQKTMILSSCHSLSPLLAHFDEASCPMKKPIWQVIEGDLWPKASKELMPTIQQSIRNWILPIITWVSLEVGHSPVKPWDDCSLANTWIAANEKPWSRVPSYIITQFLVHRNWAIINVYHLKHHLGVISYVARSIDSLYIFYVWIAADLGHKHLFYTPMKSWSSIILADNHTLLEAAWLTWLQLTLD